MACFIVSAAEAVVVTAVEKSVEHSENKEIEKAETESSEVVIPWSRKLKWLTYFLWGGAFLLAFEHVWHGEVVPWFPFLTAMSDPKDTMEMLHEMATIGVTMAVLVTMACGIMVAVVDAAVKRINAANKVTSM